VCPSERAKIAKTANTTKPPRAHKRRRRRDSNE
jgi:hypothetical protein